MIILILLSMPILHATALEVQQSFLDIEQSYAKEAIQTLSSNGIIQGYEDHTFRPYNSISRQEWATIFVKSLRLTPHSENITPFKDVPTWSASYVNTIYTEKITNGVTPDLFGSRSNILRQDIAVWYARYLGLDDTQHLDKISSFKDQRDISSYAQTSVWLMEQLNLMQGDNEYNFKPKEPVQRQAAAMVAYRVFLGGEGLKEQAQLLLQKKTDEVDGKLPDLETPTATPTPTTSNQGTKSSQSDTASNNPNPSPNIPQPNPTPGIKFLYDELRIIGNEIDLSHDNSLYQLSYQFIHKGIPVTVPSEIASDMVVKFSDNLSIFDEDGLIKDQNQLPSSGESTTVSLLITAQGGKLNAHATSVITTKPISVASVRLNTTTINQAATLNPSAWTNTYQFLDNHGQTIPTNKLPSDIQVRYEDNTQVFDQYGKVANLHLIPNVNSSFSFKLHATSAATGLNVVSDASLTVVEGNRKQQYFSISIMLYGRNDQATTKEQIAEIRDSLSKIDPNLKVTWAIDNEFVFYEERRPALEQVIQYVDTYGDEIGILSTYPNNLHSLSSWEEEMYYWLYMYRYNALPDLHENVNYRDPSIFASIPERYRPKSLSTYSINPEQAKWLKDHYGITSFMGTAATQYNVNNLYSEGSPLMPYWSHTDNSLVPAQGDWDNSGNIFMNAMTIDPIGSRYLENSSRWTLHPGDPFVVEGSAMPQLHTAEQYINNPYRELNTVNYLSIMLDANSLFRDSRLKTIWDDFVDHLPINPEIYIVGVNELAQIYESNIGTVNNQAQFSLLFRGSGYVTSLDNNCSPSDIRYLWTENAQERIILAKQDGEAEWSIIDFTDYTKYPVPPTPYASQSSKVDISYVTGRNYKLTPSAPLTAEELLRIQTHLDKIAFSEDVNYQ